MELSPVSTIVFRADGSTSQGLGHLYRSAALADMLRGTYQVVLAYESMPAGVVKTMASVYAEIIPLKNTEPLRQAEELRHLALSVNGNNEDVPVIVVLDGYHFDTEYQRRVRSGLVRVVCIDDIHDCHFVADVVINHASSARAEDYSTEAYTRLCFGPAYALVAAPFRRAAQTKRNDGQRGVLICLGGADPLNLTKRIVQIVLEKVNSRCYVIIGPAHPDRDSIQALEALHPDRLEIHESCSQQELAALMIKCDRAITSPSTISLEYLTVGGMLYLEKYVDNQTEIYTDFLEKGYALPFSSFPQETDNRALVSGVFDGNQWARFQLIFDELLVMENSWRSSKEVELVPLRAEHLEMVREWRNSPEVSQFMYNTNYIEPEQQKAWFERIKMDSTQHHFLVLFGKTAVGAVSVSEVSKRFDSCVWGFYLGDEATKGRGIGSKMLFLLADFVFEELQLNKIRAEVLSTNHNGLRVHEKLGFQREGRLREHIRRGNIYVDVVAFGLLSKEWQVNRAALKAKIFGEPLKTKK